MSLISILYLKRTSNNCSHSNTHFSIWNSIPIFHLKNRIKPNRPSRIKALHKIDPKQNRTEPDTNSWSVQAQNQFTWTDAIPGNRILPQSFLYFISTFVIKVSIFNYSLITQNALSWNTASGQINRFYHGSDLYFFHKYVCDHINFHL